MIQATRLLLWSALLAFGTVFAQTPAPANADSSTEKPGETRAIAVGDLARRMAEESYFIQGVIQRSASVAKTEALESELDGIRGSVDSIGQKVLGREFEMLPLSGLEALERHLVFLRERLGQVQDELQASTRPLSEDVGELAQRRRLWLDTREQSVDMISPALLRSIDDLGREFQQAADRAAKPLSGLISLNREASLLHARIGSGLSAVRNQIGLTSRKLWSFDSDNLYSAARNASGQNKGEFQAVKSGLAAQADFIKAFDQAARTWHTLLAVLALLSLPAFITLSRWAKKIIGDHRSLERHLSTLDRPLSAWLLFVIVCLLAIDFDGPLLRLRFELAVAWLPVMRLQPRWMHENIGHWIYSTALFFALIFLSHLITSYPFEYRLTLLVNDLLLLGSLGWLRHHLAKNDNGQSLRQQLIARALILVYSALVSIAVVANVLGGVPLAALLTEASVNSLYLALFLLAVREFIRAYARILLIPGTRKMGARTEHAGRLIEIAFKLFNLVLVLVWLAGTLNSLRVLAPLRSELHAVANFSIEFGSISITLGGVVLFCVSVFLSFWIAKTLRSVLSEDVLPGMTLPRGVANSVSTMSYYLLLMLGLLVALSAAGFELSQLALVVGALSVGIGFGLNSVVNNFVCGLILMIERPIQPGDSVELAGTTGTVRDIGIRTTTLTTFDGADVMVPNGMLLAEKLINWTFTNDRRRIDIPIGVAYGSDPKTVQALLLAVASRTPGTSDDPMPSVLFMGFGESSLDFSVRAWTDDFSQSQSIRSELGIEIHAALKEAGIDIPFPQRDVHVRSAAPPAIGDPTVAPPVAAASGAA